MVDTWATVGSCAQIGKNVHLSGGVGIGGVLEPLQAAPVIIEDDCFIGSRCIVVEGVRVEKEAVLGANVVLTASTKIIDVSGSEPKEYRGRVPARSVVIPGTMLKEFPAGTYNVPCALIIGQRKESTDKKTSLNDAIAHTQRCGVMSTALSILYLSLNEEDVFGQSLESIKSIADEIVVIDSGIYRFNRSNSRKCRC